MISRIFRALAELPATLRLTAKPRVIMTLLVKNEEQLLELNLRFHKAMGVEGFIITDNNSTDGTREIIRRYQERGWVLAVIDEPGEDYRQQVWVDRMVEMARRDFSADWIINADADEFWYAPSGSLQQEVTGVRANVLQCEVVGMRPLEGVPLTEWNETVHEAPKEAGFDLSPYSIFSHQTYKVMHRAAGYLRISMGNHKVKMLPRWKRRSEIAVFHFNLREKEAFLKKMINGGEQLARNPRKRGGRHWRYFYALHLEGRLEAEYDRVIGTHCLEKLKACGAVRTDNRFKDFWKNLKEE